MLFRSGDNWKIPKYLEMKEKYKNLQDQINEEEIGNLPKKEFRVMIVKMIQNLRNKIEAWIEKIQEKINKDLEELKNKQRCTTK